MSKELYANVAVSGLGANVTSSQTTITVSVATGFPSGGNFTIRVESEVMLVTGVSGTTFTVSRAQEGTTGTAHSAGAAVSLTITDGSLRRLVRQSLNGTNVAARREINWVPGTGISVSLTDDATNDKCDVAIASTAPSWEASFSSPGAVTNFTWANQGSGSDLGSAAVSGSGIFLRDSVQSGTWGDHARLLWVATPTAPFTLIAKIVPFLTGTNTQKVGVCFYDSSSHKMAGYSFLPDGNAVDKWTDYNTFSANYVNFSSIPGSPFTWVKLVDDNTNRMVSLSNDGTNWIKVHSVGRTDFMTANAVGFFADANNSNGADPYNAGALLLSWSLATGSN